MLDDQVKRHVISEAVKQSLLEHFPIEGKNKILSIDSVDIPEPDFTIDDEYNAKYNNKTLSVPVYASVLLKDKQGNILDKKEKFKIMDLPMFTKRGTFLVNGHEYNISIQNRVRPGIYPQKTEAGEIEGTINAAKGLPASPKLTLDPKTGIFKFKIKTSEVPLLPILHAAGITDDEIRKSWGDNLFEANKNSVSQRVYDTTLKNVASKLTGKTPINSEQAKELIRNQFSQVVLDAEINKKTINAETASLDKTALLNATQKLVKINRGEEEPVNRDSLQFKDFLWVDDFLKERIKLEARKFKPKIAKSVDRADSIDNAITPSMLTNAIHTLFTNTSLSELSDQYNPLDMESSLDKVTSLGEGAITNLRAAKESSRALNQSSMGVLDPIQTPESEKIGLVLHLTSGAKKRGRKIKVLAYNTQTKQTEEVDHDKLAESVVALPGRSIKINKQTGLPEFTTEEIRASKNGKIQLVNTKEIQYIIPRPQFLFSKAINMIPFLNNNAGPRMFMASKQIGQALPTINREEPLVQTGIRDLSTEWLVGKNHAIIAQDNGVVEKIENNRIYIKTENGETKEIPFYKDFPLNHDHVYDTEIYVKPGDKIEKGKVIADSIFTKNGKLALGQNLRSAYLADGGYNFEDGITISESAAKKLSSIHMYKKDFRPGSDIYQFKDKFLAQFPTLFQKEQIEKLNDNGVIQEGTIVKPGDPLILALRKADIDTESMSFEKISKKLKTPWRNHSLVWDSEHEGIITKVVPQKDGGHRIYIKTIEPAQVADKLAGRYGNKGVIARILPDDKMPRDKDGNPIEIIMSPLGVIGRANPGQIYEAALGKIAKKTGQPIIIENFKHDDALQLVKNKLKEAGFDEDGAEELFDADGKSIGRVMTGYSYILKLSKQAKTGFSARGAGAGESYDINKTPTSGGQEGAKALDVLSIYAMLAHGAKANLREMSVDKSTQNPEFWNALRNGAPLPAPKPTFAYNKFLSYLKGAGVNVERKGDYLQLLPFTDDDILASSNGEVKKAKFINAKDLKGKKGGFMDPSIFGKDGDKWGHINLVHPVVNPLFKNGLMAVLGITEDELNKKQKSGEIIHDIKNINLDQLEKEVNEQLKNTTSEQIEDKLNKRLRYIKALKESGIKPEKAYILTKIPVIPPQMRPIVGGEEEDSQIVAQSNFLYRDLFLSNQALQKVSSIPYIPKEIKEELRENLQKAAEALAGIQPPVGVYPDARKPAGFIEQIKGTGDAPAKMGFFQRKILRKTLDVTGRGVITPDPQLALDEVGLPEEMAWKIYRPFLEARLKKDMGMTHADVLKHLDTRSPVATAALRKEMEYRPVILNRAPSLHKFSLLAFKPFISNGKTIRIPSLVVSGYNADFDGDAMTVHVPTRPEAVEEVKQKMMASNNLFSNRAGDLIMAPKAEPIIGIYKATKTETGLKMLKEIVPEQFHDLIKPNMNKKDIGTLLTTIAETDKEIYRDVSKKLNVFGNEVAFKTGTTLTLNDLDVRDPIIEDYKKKALQEYLKFKNNPDFVNEILQKYDKLIQERLLEVVPDSNNLIAAQKSGGVNKMPQIKQMIAAGVQYTNADKSPIPIPVLGNFAKGMSINDYWITQFSSRRGMIDRKMETEEPGAFAKQLLISVTDKIVDNTGELDDEGEEFDVTDKNAYNRYIAKDVVVDGNIIAKKGELLTPKKAAMLKQKGAEKVNIHTILSARTGQFIHPKSWGIMREGNEPDPGTNIGALAGQAIAEPLQQGAMNTFHTGGVVGSKDLQGFEKVKKILLLPEEVSNQATVAKTEGKITRIEINPAGGFNIFTDKNQKLFVKPGLKVNVKEGDTIKPGDVLSDGFIHPNDILETKGIEYTRKFLVDNLQQSFKEMGMNVDRRNTEVIVKSLTENAKVIDPGNSEYIKGDIVNYDEIQKHNNQKPSTVEKSEAIIGKLLAETTNGIPAGTEITKEMLDELPDSVQVKNKPILVRPLLIGINQKPQQVADWITNLGYGYIQRGLEQRAPAMEQAPIHGTVPIPAFVFGTEFGKGKFY